MKASKFSLSLLNRVNTASYTIRQFTIADVDEYKRIRLEALEKEPGMFGNSHAMEAAMPHEDWVNRIVNPKHARFGLYCNKELIGLTAIIIDAENPAEAYMTQSYIRKEHRGKGLSALLYDARIAWAKAKGVKLLTISHRKSNLASKAANQKYGFVYHHTDSRTWPDGMTEDNVHYALHI